MIYIFYDFFEKITISEFFFPFFPSKDMEG